MKLPLKTIFKEKTSYYVVVEVQKFLPLDFDDFYVLFPRKKTVTEGGDIFFFLSLCLNVSKLIPSALLPDIKHSICLFKNKVVFVVADDM